MMAFDSVQVVIHLCKNNETFRFVLNEECAAEDVCTKVAKHLKIGPVARHLFALKIHDSYIWLSPSYMLKPKNGKLLEFDYLLRFKVPCVHRLRLADVQAFDYFFHEVRNDFLNSKISKLTNSKSREAALGLGVTDMYRVMLELGVKRDDVESDYKQYLPKEIVKAHLQFFVKTPIQKTLSKVQEVCKCDVLFVKEQYLSYVEEIAQGYQNEEYKAQIDEGGKVCDVTVIIDPHDKTEPGLKMQLKGRRSSQVHICTIEELCYISMRNDMTVEISRRNGIPQYLRFRTIPEMHSFLSLLDGYYRLSAKWTFNLCKELSTPSLLRLATIKCHGPVGGQFSYHKLDEKRSNKPGCFILRESEILYDVFHVDVCVKDSSKPLTRTIEMTTAGEYRFKHSQKTFATLSDLINTYRNPSEENFVLEECLPPTEYDRSPLLLCCSEKKEQDEVQGTLRGTSEALPKCIPTKALKVIRGHGSEFSGQMSTVYRAIWNKGKGEKPEEVAIKVLRAEFEAKYLKDFLDMANKCVFWQCDSLLSLHGITLAHPVSLVMEYLPHGRLDDYLREHLNDVKQVDLVEAGTYLANALFYLNEQSIVHGNIRCKQLMVCHHSDSTFKVKLSDPGLPTYSDDQIHWIPVEYFHEPSLSKYSITADVWAFGTTLWEIFSYGQTPLAGSDVQTAKQQYLAGSRLPAPKDCPEDVYRLMVECWFPDALSRKHPKTIMRDIHQILYEVFNSRRVHSYATVYSQSFTSSQSEDSISDTAAFSIGTETSMLPVSELDTVSVNEVISPSSNNHNLQPIFNLKIPCSHSDVSSVFSAGSTIETAWLLGDSHNVDEGGRNFDFSSVSGDVAVLSQINLGLNPTSIDSISSTIQEIFELDNSQVEFVSRLGQGFYGEVWKARLIHKDGNWDEVAVKRLKDYKPGGNLQQQLQDLQNEMAIMKTLRHQSIVEIKGVVQYPETFLVMEYVPLGSLHKYLRMNREWIMNKQLLEFAFEVAEGMEYLGCKGIVHRDLAARNILVTNDEHVKICDFGLAQFTGRNHYYILKTQRELPIRWYAPESIKFHRFSTKTDVWSYGITLFEMFSRGEDPRIPGCEDEKIHEVLEKGIRLACPLQCPNTVYTRLMRPCWENNSHDRPTFTQLLNEIRDVENCV